MDISLMGLAVTGWRIVLFGAALVAGAIASITGFGIGSILTPVLGFQLGTKLAVAVVSIPHLVGTAQRFVGLRRHVDHRVLFGFGIASAVGGLIGALLHARISNGGLSTVFGVLLLLAGTSELTGWIRRVRWGRAAAWVSGALSGLFGGMVGNQGSVRTAAMLGFEVRKEAFVATATAVALIVDGARMPVYLATQWTAVARAWPMILVAVIGVVIGTAVGARVLSRLPETVFRRAVAVLLLVLGVYMILSRSGG
jgi:uncharacterized membrane protein YfcA